MFQAMLQNLAIPCVNLTKIAQVVVVTIPLVAATWVVATELAVMGSVAILTLVLVKS